MKNFERKLKKHYHTLSKDGINASTEPTKTVVICNAGLVNGLSEEIVVSSFEKYGEIADICMPPGKSYCFVSFKSVESGTHCFESCNGCLRIAQDDKPIYLGFVSLLPSIIDKRSWENLPPGLIILEDFITVEEEDLLIRIQNFNESESGIMKNRQVKHFGFEFKYDTNNVDKNSPLSNKIPSDCDFLWKKLGERCNKFRYFLPDQLTVNRYIPGQGIPAHVDTHSAFMDPIMSLSLGSPIVMEFKDDRGAHCCVYLPRRSLLIMSEESRYLWTHCITPRKYDVIKKNERCTLSVRGVRISYTFRKLRNDECKCGFTSKCDTSSLEPEFYSIDDDTIAARLEQTHVHEVYEQIADHFSSTRHKPWPNILKFVESLEKGSILVDVGCGNGKYLGINKNLFSVGCDRSLSLVEVCKIRGFQSLTCDCLSLPFKDDIADACICIAVIHHLATQERRQQAIREIVRILRPGGRALLYVWAKDQLNQNVKSNYIKQEKKEDDLIIPEGLTSGGVSLPIHTNRTQFKHKDLLVPWKLKRNCEEKGTFLRYYHVYEKDELKNSCVKLSNVNIVSDYYDQGNWCIELQKI